MPDQTVAASPFRSLYSQGVRTAAPSSLLKKSLKGGMRMSPPIDKDNPLGDVMDTNQPDQVPGAKPSLAKPAPPKTTAMANGKFPVSAYAGTPKAPGAIASAPNPAMAPGAQPAQPTQQKETASPLTGDPASVPTGASEDVAALPPNELKNARPFDPARKMSPGKAMGFSQRGAATPAGDDAPAATGTAPTADNGDPGSYPGGTGNFQRNFSNPTSAGIYHDYTKRLFGDQGSASPAVAGADAPSLLKPARRGKPGSAAPQEDESEAA